MSGDDRVRGADDSDADAGGLPQGALRWLLTRYSVSPKHLGPPGPTDDEIWLMAMAALRAPDRNKKIPFRFVVARGRALDRLADLFEDYGRRRGRTDPELADDRRRALQAPVSIAVVARIDPHDAEVPVHEQWACVGGAISNAVTALHMMGYGAKMLSGVRASDAAVVAAHCRDGETLVGWIAAGTPSGPVKPRGEVDPAVVLAAFDPE
jgi:nitroreductase